MPSSLANRDAVICRPLERGTHEVLDNHEPAFRRHDNPACRQRAVADTVAMIVEHRQRRHQLTNQRRRKRRVAAHAQHVRKALARCVVGHEHQAVAAADVFDTTHRDERRMPQDGSAVPRAFSTQPRNLASPSTFGGSAGARVSERCCCRRSAADRRARR